MYCIYKDEKLSFYYNQGKLLLGKTVVLNVYKHICYVREVPGHFLQVFPQCA